MIKLTWKEIYQRVEKLKAELPNKKCYGIPRGGQIIAGLIGTAVDTPEEADYIIDDILDSGKTLNDWGTRNPNKPCFALVNKTEFKNEWVMFPWEAEDTLKDVEDLIMRQLEAIGENPKREGLLETPKRVRKSWSRLYAGYNINPKDFIKTFEKGSYNEMVILRDCEMYSTCEHHMLPFFGRVHVGYIPKDKVIGISKLARIADCFSRRLQIQERIGDEIADFLMKELDALGAGVVIEARHLCMCARGVEKQNSSMITSSVRGVFRENQATRDEFLKIVLAGKG